MNYRYDTKSARIKQKLLGIIVGILVLLFFLWKGIFQEEEIPEDVVYTLHNVWVMEANQDEVLYFQENQELQLPSALGDETICEKVADLHIRNGKVEKIVPKDDKITGKLLDLTESELTLEEKGKYPIDSGVQIYKVFGSLESLGREELRIGYANTDYVIENGKIIACLITKDETMEKIRILIKDENFVSDIHEKVLLSSDVDYSVKVEAGDSIIYSRGKELEITKDSSLFQGKDRIYITPSALTGKIKVISVPRNQGVPEYRGTLEILNTENGLVIINEVLLEEYLYAVVPSEMPSSYPSESLKAQAICARTYAYRKMLYAGLPQYGAHVDDSTNFQVYNNIMENVETTKAVKDTKGELLYYGEELVEAYYYSTSGGSGTNADVWSDGKSEELPYLQAVETKDLESEEGWYQWSYEVKNLDTAILEERLKKRYEMNNKYVLTLQSDGSFQSEPIKKLGNIIDIKIEKRNAGEIAEELVIEGEENTVMIKKEQTIRYVLNNGTQKVLRQDGVEVDMPNLLPSAFLKIEPRKEKGFVVGYNLIGGGYGHGVGMSQNGAKAMANNGKEAKDILEFFYKDCKIKTVY